ncbi:metallopeptidase family protein [Polyangium aurulentum]|uniref:metallopeptidase family protein n=1 Tax=Polyangium aurulentum TaxID=2567896 RepID=UPI0010AEE380|nr:metallopeptidase family protein [Polyangium aurulentum]UQA62135.1 metallopeptidase family protein [Polyangium aurulentum]
MPDPRLTIAPRTAIASCVPRTLPARVHLPSGRIVRLSEPAARKAKASAPPSAVPGGCMAALAILEAQGVASTDEGTPLDIRALPVRDAHTLRALLTHAGLLDEEPDAFTCQNCGAPFEIAPSRLLEIAPFVDGELDDPELDAPFEHQKSHPVPPIRAGASLARTVRVAPRTVEEALPLWRAEADRHLRITPAIAAAMGVVALGSERRARVLADALMSASPEAFRAIADLLHEAHYPARLVGVHRCASCGARNDLDVPLARDIPREPVGDRAPRRPFPDLDAFEAMVKAAADDVFRVRRVRNIHLFIDADVPFVDDGGEPLLGCYTPGGTDAELAIPRPPEIRIFYRTFESEYRADDQFDVEAEIRETIDHEVTHHLHQLAGVDPLDDEERAAIALDEARRVGKREIARRARKSLAQDLVGFFRVAWPLLVIAAAATYLAFCS